MKIIKVKNYDEMSDKSAEILASVVKAEPHATLGLATGSTVLGTYDRLVEMYKRGEISFADISSFNLDEYVGLGGDSDQSYVHYMRKHLFCRTDFDLKNTHLPDGAAENAEEECARYSALLAANPRRIQLLGLGSDGHIGFNEPYSPFDGTTHVAELAESTMSDNSRLFERLDDVPRKAITMGIAEIMQARSILILVSGAAKAEAVRAMVNGEVNESCPASVLQRHGDVTLIVDEAAAGLL